MSGHSKWASIKHKKAATDAKRGRIFTRLIKEITVAARIGGGDPDGNPRLRAAVAAGKAQNMPQDNIKRAIKKGTGALPGQSYEEVVFEGYGPSGVAVLLEVLTDNRNRTVAEVRHVFGKHGGNMGEAGCVAWMFEKKGVILVETSKADEDELMELVLDAGADDMGQDGDNYEITTSLQNFEAVKKALEEKEIPVALAELTMHPQSTVRLEGKDAVKMIRLMEFLEDHDDIQNVYANFDIDDSVMENMT
jgi:YebC/PmpR family DNA-binding regulatory protein